ncbi:MAG: hypothetical protein GF334_11890 [Candidatus Altiarchaeales archaeon]|nr:hypothetical protein [Candidatus Altiarchaeales archaeon]
MKINRLHVLVHPGYTLQGIGKNRSLPSSEPLLRRQQDLMKKYRQKVEGLQDDEVLVIFSPSQDYEYARDYRKKRSGPRSSGTLKKPCQKGT